MTSLVLFVICAVVYAAGVAGFALALGSPIGWLVLAVAGMLPGAYLFARAVDEHAVQSERKRFSGEQFRPPPDAESGPAPDPVTMPRHD